MAGFFAPHRKASAISYYPEALPVDWQSEKYFYVTRRTFEQNNEKKSLICVGGPDSLVPHETPHNTINRRIFNDILPPRCLLRTFIHIQFFSAAT
jgi:hypothetical protein